VFSTGTWYDHFEVALFLAHVSRMVTWLEYGLRPIAEKTSFRLSSVSMKLSTNASEKRAFRRLVFLTYVTVVLGATLAPLSGGAYAAVSGLDKVVHVALFGGVAVLLCWNLALLNLRSATRVLAITVAFAALIELVQSMLWYRSGDLWDLLAGSLGGLIGVGFALFLADAKRPARERSS